MTVMCRLVCGKSYHRTTKVLSHYLLQRSKSDMMDSVISITSGCITSQSVSATRKQPLEVVTSQSSRWKDYQPFLEMMELRREEARRSILVEIEGIGDSGGLKKFCESYGPVNKCYMYRNSGKNFVLVEFKHLKVRNSVLNSAFHSKDPQTIPVTSPYLYFRHRPGNKLEPALRDNTEDIKCDEDKILKQLISLKCDSNDRLKTEIDHIHQNSLISDLSVRLRYFTCNQLEHALNGLFANVKALPFGSSVSGFGRNTGDLDIFIQFRRNLASKVDKSQLFYHSKAWLRDKNLQLKVIGDLISVMLPGCSGVVSILSARVPIIKYRQSITNLECDVQNSSISGVDFGHILWILNHWDARVSPLVYTLRIWAAHNNVVSAKKPSPFITNFCLVVMIIFFLQTEKILPPLQLLQNMSGKLSRPSLDTNCDLVFPDLRKIPDGMWEVKNESGQDVDGLLLMFFTYYSKFNYEKNKISILHGTSMPKSLFHVLEIENPVDPALNIARNVGNNALQVFRRAAKEAAISLAQGSSESQSLTRILRVGKDMIADGRSLTQYERRKKNLAK